ncbi:O-antigen ligase family protein [Lachnospiraceae bacterium 42-17]|jgi:O-antigen ligase|nr:O-antigen ligase family protein [Dorea sp.]
MEKKLELSAKILYLCLALSTFNSFIYTSRIQPVLVKLTLVLAVCLLMLRLLKHRIYRRMPCLILMVLFCASFVLSAVMNRQYGIVGNGKWIIWTGIQFFVLYLCDVERDIKEYKKEFYILSHIMIIYGVVSSLISLGMLAASYSDIIITADEEMVVCGFTWGRLWGVYTDPNYGAVFSVIVIILSVLFFLRKQGRVRILYCLGIIACFLYLIFSDSRTGEVSLICSLGLFVCIAVIHKEKEKKAVVRIGMAALAVLVTAGVSFTGNRLIKTEYNRKLAPVFAEMFPKKETNQHVKNKVGRKQDIETDVSNGRFALWESGIEVWKSSPVYGTGYTTFVSYAKEHTPDIYAVNTGGADYVSLHNTFINTLAYQGSIGFVLFLMIAFLIALYVVKPVLLSEREVYLELGAMLSCISAVLISMMFYMEGIYTNSPGTFVLWVFCGYMVQYSYRKRKGAA